MSKADASNSPILARPAVLAGIASVPALPIATAAPAAATQGIDAELSLLGGGLHLREFVRLLPKAFHTHLQSTR
jgi:hypothetical protein